MNVLFVCIRSGLRQLDLYHAIIITHQLAFLAVGVLFPPPSKGIRLIVYYWTVWVMYVLIDAWGLYIWITAPNFGSPSLFSTDLGACNHSVKYIFLFIEIRATVGWLRWMGVATGCIYAVFVLRDLIWARANIHFLELAPSLTASIETSPRMANAMRFIFLCIRLIVFALATANLELTVRHNNVQPGENVWSFGQIVALIIAAGNIFEVAMFIIGKGWRLDTQEDEESNGTPDIHSPLAV